MDRLLTPADISERYGFRDKDHRTAKKRMREMEHLENPLRVTETAVARWEARNTLPPASEARTAKKRKVVSFPTDGKHLISRTRPAM